MKNEQLFVDLMGIVRNGKCIPVFGWKQNRTLLQQKYSICGSLSIELYQTTFNIL